MELGCAAWLVSHEGGSFSEWREGAIYDENPVIMGIWLGTYWCCIRHVAVV